MKNIKEKIIEILDKELSLWEPYKFKTKGEYIVESSLFNRKLADQLLPLFSLQKQEIVEEIEKRMSSSDAVWKYLIELKQPLTN